MNVVFINKILNNLTLISGIILILNHGQKKNRITMQYRFVCGKKKVFVFFSFHINIQSLVLRS